MEPLPWTKITANWAEQNARLAAWLASRGSASSFSAPSSGSRLVDELERERERIARDLHSGAGQPLSGMPICLEMLEDFVRNPASAAQPAAENAVVRLRALAADALGQVRAVSHRLHPPDWQLLPLREALTRLIETSGITVGFQCSIDLQPLPAEIPHDVQVVLYRCVQEALANIIRHSGASAVSISLGAEASALHCAIRDNGRGFSGSGSGIGLQSMRRLTESVGGQCTIQSSPQGTSVILNVPISTDSSHE